MALARRRRGIRSALLTGIVAVVVVAAAGMGTQGDAAAHVAAPHEPDDPPLPSPDPHVVHPLHEGYTPPLHPSVLHLSDYPPSGSGEAADLEFTVTYMGGWEEDAAANWRAVGSHPPVRLDVTGSGYEEMYLVTNITSNIGASDPGVFAPYDHETEATLAEPGRTYTVRAQIEFVAEGFLPVHAFGLDDDIVTVNVAASAGLSMPYYEYVATGEDYLDHLLAAPGPVEAHKIPPDAGFVAALEAQHGVPLKDMLSPVGPDGLPVPFAESSMPSAFDAAGRITTVGLDLEPGMPVHGVRVCAYDMSEDALGDPIYTLLNITDGMPACDYTDATGNYSITGIAGADPHDMSRADVFIEVDSIGYGGLLELVTYVNEVYYVYAYADFPPSFEYNGTLLARDIDIPRNGLGMDGAARIISVLSDGMAFFELHGHVPAPLVVKWHHAVGTSVFPDAAVDGAAYQPGRSVMWLDGNIDSRRDNSFNMHTILHELAHHVHTIHDPDLDYYCIPHWYTLKHDERCAWGEGWAQLVPHLVYDRAVISTGPGRLLYDIEAGASRFPAPPNYIRHYSGDFEPSGRPIGDKVEGRVAAAMWDMSDNDVNLVYDALPGDEPFTYYAVDDVAAGPGAVVGMFFNGTYDTFAEFYDKWEIEMRHQSAESIARWHGMSFAVPSDVAYYQFAGELDGVFDTGLAGLVFRPNYIAISADNSTIAVTSSRGQGIQLINATDGAHLGLHAARGYDHDCMLEYNPYLCILRWSTNASSDPGYGKFSSMDGIAFDRNGRFMLVTDGLTDRVHILHEDGRHAGQFGSSGDGDGQFDTPDGAAFLPDGRAAVADSWNRRVQLFNIANDGSDAASAGQFESYLAYNQSRITPHEYTTQQLSTGPDGRLHAVDFRSHTMWTYPQDPAASGTVVRTNDEYNWRDGTPGGLAGVAVGRDGLAYASNYAHGYVRVYNLSAAADVESTTTTLGGHSLAVRSVNSTAGIVDEFGSLGPLAWQLYRPFGVALGPPADPARAAAGDMRVYIADHIGVKVYEKDRVPPTVTAVWAHTPDGRVAAGSTVEIAANFSERVTVSGALAMDINAGANATYVSGSGSRTLTFNYTVPAGAESMYLDYLGGESLRLSGPAAAVMDGSGNAANLTLPARGAASSLAANSALWAYGSGQAAAPLEIPRGPPAMPAVEGAEVRFAVNATGAPTSYSLSGEPDGARIGTDGTFSWTPSEEQDGLHAFVVNASSGDNSSIRTFRVLVAEDNRPPRIESIPDKSVSELSELRFTVDAADDDLPAQQLLYRLQGGPYWGPTILPNGTFVWTPSTYHDGETYTFNVTVSDGFDGGEGSGGGAGTASVLFNVTVQDVPQAVETITVVAVYAVNGTYGAGDTVIIEVEFSAPVRVTGSPGLHLDVGEGRTATAAYNGTFGRFVLFAYAVEAGHASADLDYSGTDALSTGGGSAILAASGEDVVDLALPRRGEDGSLALTSSVVVNATEGLVTDRTLPNATATPGPIAVVAVSAPSGTYGTGENVRIAVNFSAPVSVSGSPELLLNVGGGQNASAAYDGSDGSVVFFAYVAQDGHYSIDLEYAGTDALRTDGDGDGITPATGTGDVALALPDPGGHGSLSRTSDVFVRTSQDVLDIGVIGHADAGGAAEAARMAAADFGAGPAGMLLLNVTAYGGVLDALTVVGALETAYAGGAGPGVFIGPLDDGTLRAAVQYANDAGIVLVSTDSSAPSLAVPGDRVIRLSAGDAMRATALAGLVSRSTPASIHVVVDEDHYGPASRTAAMPPAQGSFLQWYAEAFVPYAFPSPQDPIGLSGSREQWADEAQTLATAARTHGTGMAAVAFFGPIERLEAFADHADEHTELLSARWFTAVPPGSPIDLAGSLSTFAARTNLTAVSWTVPTNDVTGRIDSRLSMLGTAAGSVDSYAAYDAVSVLGRAAAEAGASAGADGIVGALPAALAGYEGALGDISVDEATGDLVLPGNYTVWTAGAGADGTDWEAQPERVDAVPTCGAYLSPQDFGLRVVPGGISDPSAQAVVNSGWFPIKTVELGASMWTGGATVGMWPASLTEVSRGGLSGTYAPLSDATAIAEDVGIGASVPAWFRINTTGADVPQSGTIEQTVTYTLAC